MASEPTPKREQIQAAYDEWQAGADVDTAGRAARFIPYLLQRVRDLELAYADGLESRRLALLPDTEREVHISELEMKIDDLERQLAEARADGEISNVPILPEVDCEECGPICARCGHPLKCHEEDGECGLCDQRCGEGKERENDNTTEGDTNA